MEITELSPSLHVLWFPIGPAYLVRGSDGFTLIDTGPPGAGPRLAEAIRACGGEPADLRRVILTHFHVDHVGGAADVVDWGNGVTVFAHHADAAIIGGREIGPAPVLGDWERPLYERVSARTPEPEPVEVDRELDHGDLLDLGDVPAVVVAAPGHTPGSVAVHLPEQGVLFTGDAVARMPDGEVVLGVFNADPAEATVSFHELAALDPAIVCFGHGEPLTDAAAAVLRAAARRYPVGVPRRGW